jgi:four helix bundle protein
MENRKGFESLEAWKVAREFRKEIAIISKGFPQHEQFKLRSQIDRSARSVSANIAEGYGRYHYQENIQACRIARGSLSETLDHLILANDEQYIDEQKFIDLRAKYDHCLKLLNGYVLYLKNKKKEKTAP